jgi:hypothetical protein
VIALRTGVRRIVDPGIDEGHLRRRGINDDRVAEAPNVATVHIDRAAGGDIDAVLIAIIPVDRIGAGGLRRRILPRAGRGPCGSGRRSVEGCQRRKAALLENDVRACGLDVVIRRLIRLETAPDERHIGSRDGRPSGSGVEVRVHELAIRAIDVLRAGKNVPGINLRAARGSAGKAAARPGRNTERPIARIAHSVPALSGKLRKRWRAEDREEQPENGERSLH